MLHDPALILFILLIQIVGFTVKGLVGFGNSPLTGPLLSFRLDNSVISPGGVLMDAPTNAWIAWKNRKNYDWRKVLPLTAAVLCGVIPGTFLLKTGLPWVIKALLGLLVIGIGVEMATRKNAKARALPPWVKYVVAVVSGVFSGLYGINLLIAAYLERTSNGHSEFKGSLCFLFVTENIFRTCLYAASGLFTPEALAFTLVTIPGAVIGLWLGGRIERRISEKAASRSVIVLFIFSGISILVKSVLYHS